MEVEAKNKGEAKLLAARKPLETVSYRVLGCLDTDSKCTKSKR